MPTLLALPALVLFLKSAIAKKKKKKEKKRKKTRPAEGRVGGLVPAAVAVSIIATAAVVAAECWCQKDEEENLLMWLVGGGRAEQQLQRPEDKAKEDRIVQGTEEKKNLQESSLPAPKDIPRAGHSGPAPRAPCWCSPRTIAGLFWSMC